MKVLRVIASMDPKSGGPCQGIRNAIPALGQLGVSNEVVCLDHPDAAFLVKDSFKIHALGPAAGPWQKSKRLIPWLMENLGRFDAVIIHGLWLYHGYAVRKAWKQFKNQREKRPKLYVMPHGMLDPYFQKASGRKLKALRNIIYWRLVESKNINEADGVLFTTESELMLARQPFKPYKPKQELNVGYGIADPPGITEATGNLGQQPLAGGNAYLLFLSRIHEKKGVDLLVKAYASMLENQSHAVGINKSADFPKLVIAGPGLDTDFGQDLLKVMEESPALKTHIFFPGMLTGRKKWDAFYGCEAFILPSHQENFGIAVAEALSCSKPVLITNQVNIWHEIQEEGGGIVAPDTLEGVKALLQGWIRQSSSEKERMSANARRTFDKFFRIEPAAARFKKAISQE